MIRIAVLFFGFAASCTFAAYHLEDVPYGLESVLDRPITMKGTWLVSDFAKAISKQSQSSILLKNSSDHKLYIKTDFVKLPFGKVLQSISTKMPLDITWGYNKGFDHPAYIQISTAGIDLMNERISYNSTKHSDITLHPNYGQQAQQGAAANP